MPYIVGPPYIGAIYIYIYGAPLTCLPSNAIPHSTARANSKNGRRWQTTKRRPPCPTHRPPDPPDSAPPPTPTAPTPSPPPRPPPLPPPPRPPPLQPPPPPPPHACVCVCVGEGVSPREVFNRPQTPNYYKISSPISIYIYVI
jgi:hypothetical protein